MNVVTGDANKVLDTLTFDAIVTDPPVEIQRKPHLVEQLRERAGGRLAFIGQAAEMVGDLRRFAVPPQRVCIWAVHGGFAHRARAGVGFLYYPIYLWGITEPHDGPVVDIWAVPQDEGSGHPGEKPVDVMEAMIRLVCPPGGTVVDPYCGSGSTLLAAAACGREAVGIELDERWAATARERVAA